MQHTISRRLSEIKDTDLRSRLAAALAVEPTWQPPAGWSLSDDQREDWTPEQWTEDEWTRHARAEILLASGPLTRQPTHQVNASLGEAIRASRVIALLLNNVSDPVKDEPDADIPPELTFDAASYAAWLTIRVEATPLSQELMDEIFLTNEEDAYAEAGPEKAESLCKAVRSYCDLEDRATYSRVGPAATSKSWERRHREAQMRAEIFLPLLKSRLRMTIDQANDLAATHQGKHDRNAALICAFLTDVLGIYIRTLEPTLGRQKTAIGELKTRGLQIVQDEGGYPWDKKTPSALSENEYLAAAQWASSQVA